MKKIVTGFSLLFISLPTFAAVPVNLSHQPVSYLFNTTRLTKTPPFEMKEINRTTDFNNTLHIRLKQNYQGYEVFGGEAIMHVPNAGRSTRAFAALAAPNASLNGKIYDGLHQDLANTPAFVFSSAQQDKALQQAITHYQDAGNKAAVITEQTKKLIVFVDKDNKVHWAYIVSFLASKEKQIPARPTYILDAVTLSTYENWDNIKTAIVSAGGLGGNHKTGKKIFDGMQDHLPSFLVEKSGNNCYMKNKDYVLTNYNTNDTMKFTCKKTDAEHNDIYWNGNHDQVQTTFSPSNDAMFGTQVTINMFRDWYNIPVLIDKKGKAMVIPLIVHNPVENAYWDSVSVTFGDSVGSSRFNPFTSLDTVAHEINHGFTEQHSDLHYYSQSGGLNESYSDMAGIAAEYFIYGKTDFLVGWGDEKGEGVALRYMEKPSKDCYGKTPGDHCSIDNMSQYSSSLGVHYSSGIFNRVYYVLANTSHWNPKKAFDVMVQANMNYWTADTTFLDAACGVMKAAGDYKYNLKDVAKAFAVVELDVNQC